MILNIGKKPRKSLSLPRKSLSLLPKSHEKVLIWSCNSLSINAASSAEKGNYKKTTKNYL